MSTGDEQVVNKTEIVFSHKDYYPIHCHNPNHTPSSIPLRSPFGFLCHNIVKLPGFLCGNFIKHKLIQEYATQKHKTEKMNIDCDINPLQDRFTIML